MGVHYYLVNSLGWASQQNLLLYSISENQLRNSASKINSLP